MALLSRHMQASRRCPWAVCTAIRLSFSAMVASSLRVYGTSAGCPTASDPHSRHAMSQASECMCRCRVTCIGLPAGTLPPAPGRRPCLRPESLPVHLREDSTPGTTNAVAKLIHIRRHWPPLSTDHAPRPRRTIHPPSPYLGGEIGSCYVLATTYPCGWRRIGAFTPYLETIVTFAAVPLASAPMGVFAEADYLCTIHIIKR